MIRVAPIRSAMRLSSGYVPRSAFELYGCPTNHGLPDSGASRRIPSLGGGLWEIRSDLSGGRIARGGIEDLFSDIGAGETTINEDFDCATADNIERIERLAQLLIDRSKAKLDKVCAALKGPKWQPSVPVVETIPVVS